MKPFSNGFPPEYFSHGENYDGTIRQAWYYYQALPDAHKGLYSFFSAHPHIKTNWLTPGMVPAGRAILINTVRLLDLVKRNDEEDERNWLQFKVASHDTELKIPPWVLYDAREIHLPVPLVISELVSFVFQIHIDASEYTIAPENRKKVKPMTLILGVQEALRF